jgi:hypothetical protein
MSYGAGGNDFSWEPWYGGALTVRVPGSSAGLQVEVGRHRLTQRYYEYEGDALIAEFHRWEPLVRLGMAFPF